MQATLIDAGMDYLRLTSCDRAAQAQMIDFYRKVVEQDVILGYEEKKGGAFGFFGHKTRHALYGSKKEWDMLQVSGYESKRAWILASEGTQATRVDLQLTYQVGEDQVENTIRDAYNAACALQDAQRRHMKVTMIETRHHAQTVYIGSRASDIFLRIYDKFAESGKEEYRGCVRYELELKGRASKAVWQKIVNYEMNLTQALQMTVSMFNERGVVLPQGDISPVDVRFPKPPKTTAEATAAWFARQIAPTVRKLTSTHGWSYCFSALFFLAVEEYDRARIVNALANVWGS